MIAVTTAWVDLAGVAVMFGAVVVLGLMGRIWHRQSPR